MLLSKIARRATQLQKVVQYGFPGVLYSDNHFSQYGHDPVIFDYKELHNPEEGTEKAIQYTFGPESAGACLVRNVPGFNEARLKLLQLGDELSKLPPQQLAKLEVPSSLYQRGWCHRKEKVHGMFSLDEGTFSASINHFNTNYSTLAQQQTIDCNLLEDFNAPQKIKGLVHANVWPKKELPEFRQAFLSLAQIIYSAGQLLAQHIDKYLHQASVSYTRNALTDIVNNGDHSGTFYHYYFNKTLSKNDDTWGAWHNDFSALTGICPALYTDATGKMVDFYDREGGLYYKNRYGENCKIHAPKDSIIFIIGETMQILSGGILEAAPHCVVKHRKSKDRQLSRNAFSVHLQPSLKYRLYVPEQINQNAIFKSLKESIPDIRNRWENGITFGDFMINSIEQYQKGAL